MRSSPAVLSGHPRRRMACAVLAVGAAIAVASTTTTTATPAPRALSAATGSNDVLLEWNLLAQQHTIPLRPTAHGETRGMAMVQGAVYDAVNAIDGGHQPYLLDLAALDLDEGASVDAAIATAAHDVLVAIVGDAARPAIHDAYAATLATIADGAAEDEGVRAGGAAATAMLASRIGDGFMAPFTPVIGTDPGDWRPTTPTALDPDGWVGYLRPFLMTSPDQFPTGGPNALTSDKYTKEFNEVKELGSLTSTTRTADQTTAAVFWQFAPIALWNGAFRTVVNDRDLNAADGARLFAMINMAAADGAIACWNDKYRWSSWRPIAAIREADTDGNPATVADPEWRSLFDPTTAAGLGTPPFPEHPSGHGCVTGSTIAAAQSFFGTDKVAISVNSGRFPGQPRSFDRLSLVTKEVIDARVWGGIHFRSADVQGVVTGQKVVHWMNQHYFAPVS